jgi:hypothetical protein
MKKSYGSGHATHISPGSCGASPCKGGVEALTGEGAGWVFGRVRKTLWDADAVGESARARRVHRYREVFLSPARPGTPCTHAGTSRGNREVPGLPRPAVARGLAGKSKDTLRGLFDSAMDIQMLERMLERPKQRQQARKKLESDSTFSPNKGD